LRRRQEVSITRNAHMLVLRREESPVKETPFSLGDDSGVAGSYNRKKRVLYCLLGRRGVHGSGTC